MDRLLLAAQRVGHRTRPPDGVERLVTPVAVYIAGAGLLSRRVEARQLRLLHSGAGRRDDLGRLAPTIVRDARGPPQRILLRGDQAGTVVGRGPEAAGLRSEEHTSELQSR